MLKKHVWVLLITLVSLIPIGNVALAEDTAETLTSPNGQVSITVHSNLSEREGLALWYDVNYGDKTVIKRSRLDIRLDNHLSEWALAIENTPKGQWINGLQLTGVEREEHRSTWEPVYGERSEIDNHYNSMTLSFVQSANDNYTMNIEVRAFNEGIAFRYFFPDNRLGIFYRVMSEGTEFAFDKGAKAWFSPWAQGPVSILDLKDWPTTSERPLTLKLDNGLYASLAEAKVVDYVRTKFALAEERKNTITTEMHTPIDIIPGTGTPWRVVMVAEKPGDLIENNDILLNLNDPSTLSSTDWIKPGKIVRDMSLTEKGAKEWIDFAAKHNIQYLLFDWLWYGWAFTFDSDASTVDIDLDLKEIIEYGKEKGVGIWVYVNQHALLEQDEEIFPLYKEWGLVGVKYGFVQVGSHRWTAWLHDSIERAAENELMVNIHDEFRPTGEQRTWPNIMTVEGIRGNEEMPDATNNTTIPFTRGIAGMGDYTICYYDDRIKTTHAHQLALSVVMYSPLQTLFWYDSADDYQGEPEIAFFEAVPTIWDDTQVLSGDIGQHIVTARRSDEDWFVGAITNNDAREVTVNFDFLDRNETYLATVYFDDESVDTRTHVGIRTFEATSDSVKSFALKASGGVAIHLQKQ
ncbi:glycoside hydrolase family 97 N-terminal domain-containing protein [Marinimicrobium sp. ARAG 43.8]|uniref:glycoside hydrolase family 97 protein n=1 Tax=Marinimicrobium sp. ARAG 43.8 TaxID=3418719 RepID=UPI003CEEF978